MKVQLSVAVLFLWASFASGERKQADAEYLEKQRKVLRIYVGVDSNVENKYNHVHQEFSFNQPENFKDPKVLDSFLKVYKRGLLPRDGAFTLHCHKNRHDTFKLFDLFYQAKDFDTFYKIAEWAKNELHPMQFSFAFTLAVFHRPDTQGLVVPPLYEIHPHFFVPSEVMHQAYFAKSMGLKYRKIQVNNTAWEYSWHRDMTSGPHRTGRKWNGHDTESKLSYFREDVELADWYTKFMLHYSSWFGHKKYPDIHFHRRGEVYYIAHNWLLRRYNLERYANKLPPVDHLEFDVPIKTGYNPKMMDPLGRSLLARPDNMEPYKANSYDFWSVDTIERRLYDAIDLHKLFISDNFSTIHLDEKHGVDALGQAIFGTRDTVSRDFYQAWYYAILEATNNMVHYSNDREYTSGVLGRLMTVTRDPAFYMILASMDEIFDAHLSHFHPYSKEELSFPGVKITDFETSKLITFFEYFDFELTNGVAFEHRPERVEKKYMASQFRLNHKPFNFKIKVTAEKPVEALVKVFIGPKYDGEYRPLSMNQARHAFYAIDYFNTKLAAGENVIERQSHESMFYEDPIHYRDLYEKVNKSLETQEPFYHYEHHDCGLPQNLMLPRGSPGGKDYQVFVMVVPFDYQRPAEGVCGHNMVLDQYSIGFPFDRWAVDDHFHNDNILTKDVTVYLKYEKDINRSPA